MGTGGVQDAHSDSTRLTAETRVHWRAVTTAVAVATPVGIGVLHPRLGEILVVSEPIVALMIICTALFGSRDLSDRAFRLLRWIWNRPEPEAPETAQAGPVRRLATTRSSARRRR